MSQYTSETENQEDNQFECSFESIKSSIIREVSKCNSDSLTDFARQQLKHAKDQKAINHAIEQIRERSVQHAHKAGSKGYGLAFEDLEVLFAKLKGGYGRVVGGDNYKNGADAVINGIPEQMKCYKSGKDVGASFNKIIRYINRDGSPMVITVPHDKHEDAVKKVAQLIRNGSVDLPNNPIKGLTGQALESAAKEQAEKLVKKGRSFSYDEIQDISKGDFSKLKGLGAKPAELSSLAENLSNDMARGALFAGGITMALNGKKLLKGSSEEKKSAALEVGKSAAKSAATVAATTAVKEASKGVMKGASKEVSKQAAKVVGKQAGRVVGKTLGRNGPAAVAVAAMQTASDSYKYYKGDIDGKTYAKEVTGNVAEAGGVVGGAMAGAAIGSAVPVVGTAVGALVGGMIGGWGARKGANAATKNKRKK